MQFQSSFRAVSEQFQSNFRAILEMSSLLLSFFKSRVIAWLCNEKKTVSVQFQSTSEQVQCRFSAVSNINQFGIKRSVVHPPGGGGVGGGYLSVGHRLTFDPSAIVDPPHAQQEQQIT